jgi:spoIIIJ-associated protein
MESLEFSGKTTEDALQRASQHFQLPMDKLEVEVISTGSSGLLGFIGAKKARIMVRPLADSAKEAMDEVMREFRGEEAPPAKTAAKASRRTIANYGDDSEEQGSAPVRAEVVSQPEDTASAHDHRESYQDHAAPPREPESAEVVEASRQVLERIVSALDTEAKVTADNGRGAGIELEVEGGEVGILIGRRGQTLDALQYLTTRIVSHQEGRPVRISVDAGGYRRRRRESLEELALRMADKARHTRRPVSVGPLSSPERRVVHLALKSENGVSTSSRGRGELKKVLILPRS